MHKAFYKLHCEPFDTRPDRSFLWLGDKYKEALSLMRYGILDNKGSLVLTGGAGTGKTTLLQALMEGLSDDVLRALVPLPNLHQMEFFNTIAEEFDLKRKTSKAEFLMEFGNFLQKAEDDGKKVVLTIDEAHLLSQEILGNISLLVNIKKVAAKPNIIFVGQPQFKPFLARPEHHTVNQSLSLCYHIDPLTHQETGEYIQHRLSVAGVDNTIFTDEAIRTIHQYSGGTPRKINVICHQAIFDGAMEGRKIIDQSVMDECVRKLEYLDSNRYKFVNNLPKSKMSSEISKRNRLIAGAIALVFVCMGGYLGNSYLQQLLSGKNANRQTRIETAATEASTRQTVPTKRKMGTEAEPNPTSEAFATDNAPPVPAIVVASPNNVTVAPHSAASDSMEEAGKMASEATQSDFSPAFEQDQQSIPKKVVLTLQANSLSLTAKAKTDLAKFVDALVLNPGARVEVRGYVSARENSEENIRLSVARAKAIKRLLLKKGVRESKIVVKGMGNADPLDRNDTYEGRSKNRRVEIEVVQ